MSKRTMIDLVNAAPAQASTTTDVLIVIGALLGAVFLLAVVLLILRRRLLSKSEESAAAGGIAMTLDELRELRDAGDVSEEEFEALRAALVRGAGGDPSRAGEAQVMRARPGYDLTGEPLPAQRKGEAADGSNGPEVEKKSSDEGKGGSGRSG